MLREPNGWLNLIGNVFHKYFWAGSVKNLQGLKPTILEHFAVSAAAESHALIQTVFMKHALIWSDRPTALAVQWAGHSKMTRNVGCVN